MSDQQRLRKVKYSNLKGLKDLEISFEDKNVTGIFGVNGCGKSTILHSLICFYKPKDSSIVIDYKFSMFFKQIDSINWNNSQMEITTFYRDGSNSKELDVAFSKTTDRWLPKYDRRPDRNVFFIGIDTCVPDIERTTISDNKLSTTREAISSSYIDELKKSASHILGNSYTDIFNSNTKSKKKYLSVEKNKTLSYHSLSMGAGEQRVFKILDVLYKAPKYSLIVIDELDLTLHTSALNKLLDTIVKVADKNKLQVVFTSHREELTNRNDINIRHILQTNNKTFCFNNSTPECIDRLTGKTMRILNIFVEDDLSKAIILELLRDNNIRKRTEIHIFGAIDNAFVASVGLDITKENLDNILFVLDGDRYRTNAEKETMMKTKYSGTESDKEERRQKALSIIKQFNLPESVAPEEYICKMLQKSTESNEIVDISKQITTVPDPHLYLNELLEQLGESRDVGLTQIIKEFKKNKLIWKIYTKDVQNWIKDRKAKLNL